MNLESLPRPIEASIAADQVDSRRRGRPPLGRRRVPSVSRYRVFMTVVFCCIVLVNELVDRNPSARVSGDVVGPVSVVIWAMTLLGAFGVGPMGRLRAAMRR